ncbi:MAG: glycosyltransferase family 1 protein [Actinomycetota bacterium]|nr:MAG: glycosyltransferase family 1 protein [Actinomycetota bacterium]
MGRFATKRVFLMAEQVRSKIPGGIGTHTTALLRGLSTIRNEFPGIELEILVTRATTPETLDRFGIPIRYLPFRHSVYMRLSDFNFPLLGQQSGIYHSFSMFIPPVSKRGQQRVCTVHDLAFVNHPDFFTKRGAAWHTRKLKSIVGGNFPVVTVSEHTRDALLSKGIHDERIWVIESGADHLGHADFKACQELLKSLGVGRRFILSVSTQEPRKNLDGLIRAFELSRKSNPISPELLVVGARGWGTDTKQTPGVHYLGHVPEGILVALYQLAAFLVYVPFEEGFGLPVVEAMWHGLPVVASAIPAAAHCVELVNPNDTDSIAKGISRLVKDQDRREALIAKGLDRVKNMTWANSARDHMKLWEQM